jgi:hypothetical protein|tara:strand:+ start:539 stop:793 length:255 start_codon:yes stop_codon:yes gene_type:complete
MRQIKIVSLVAGQFFISEIEEVGADIGQPDCKLIKPYIINGSLELHKYMVELTDEEVFMISSDKILTLADPNQNFLKQYEELTK